MGQFYGGVLTLQMIQRCSPEILSRFQAGSDLNRRLEIHELRAAFMSSSKVPDIEAVLALAAKLKKQKLTEVEIEVRNVPIHVSVSLLLALNPFGYKCLFENFDQN